MLTLQAAVVLSVAAACYGQSFTCPSALTSSHQDTTNCNAYWVCENYVAYRLNCRTNYNYDPARNNCFYKFIPQDCTMPASVRSTTADSNSCASSTNSKYPDASDCSSYYWCQNDVPYKQSCDAGTFFDPLSGNCYASITPPNCQMPTSARLYTSNTFICPDSNTQRYPDTSDCSAYYYCINSVGTRYKCKNGEYFDQTYRDCYSGINPTNCKMP